MVHWGPATLRWLDKDIEILHNSPFILKTNQLKLMDNRDNSNSTSYVIVLNYKIYNPFSMCPKLQLVITIELDVY